MTDQQDQQKDIQEAQGIIPRATWPFGGDHIMQQTAEMPEKHQAALRWLFFYAIENELTLQQVADELKIHKTTIYRVYKGNYGAAIDNVIEAIETFRRLSEERQTLGTTEFVETSLARKIWKICDSAIIYNSIAFIYGDSHIGKTFALEEYARRNNHGTTKYIRMPASAGVQLMMKELAQACALSRDSAYEKLRERVLKALDKNNLVIVDEVHQTFTSYHKGQRLGCLEVLREIHDRTGCGMVLVGTNVFKKELQQGLHRDFLSQLTKRGIFELQLPATPPRKDLDAISEAFGLGKAEGDAEILMKTIISQHGLGKFCKFLTAANRMAAKKKQKTGWHHFISAHDIIARMSAD